MSARYYAIRLGQYRLVAAELDTTQAAEFLDAARPILLATPAELTQLARQHDRALVLIASPASSRASHSLAGSGGEAGRLGNSLQVSRRPARTWLEATVRRKGATAAALPIA